MTEWLEALRAQVPWMEDFSLLDAAATLDTVTFLDMDTLGLPVDLHDSGVLNPVPIKRPRKRLAPDERARRRRKRHRELVARSRAQTKERMTQLREQEVALQKAINSIVDNYTRDQRKPTCALTDAAVESLRDRFIEAVVVSESIFRENLRLAAEIEKKVKYQNAVVNEENEIGAEVECEPDIPPEGRLLHRRGFWMYFADDDVPFYYEPYADVKCEELMRQTYASAGRLQDGFDKRKYPVMAVRCFGWNVQRMLDETSTHKLRFHFSKQVSTASSTKLRESLLQQTWGILNTPDEYAKLYRHKMVERLLQRVGDHTSIIVRNNPTKLHALSLRSFNMMRAYTDVDAQGRRRTQVLTLVLAPQDIAGVSLQTAKGIVYITRGFTYISFVELDEGTLEVTYGGKGNIVSQQHAAYLLNEIGCTWLRWENMVMPQRLLAFDEAA